MTINSSICSPNYSKLLGGMGRGEVRREMGKYKVKSCDTDSDDVTLLEILNNAFKIWLTVLTKPLIYVYIFSYFSITKFVIICAHCIGMTFCVKCGQFGGN